MFHHKEVSTVFGDDLDFFGEDLISGTTQEPVQDFLGDDDLEVCMNTVVTDDAGPTEDILATTAPDAAAAAVDDFFIATAPEDNALTFPPAEAASTSTADADASLVEEFELLDPLAVPSSGPIESFLDANGSDSAAAGFHEVIKIDPKYLLSAGNRNFGISVYLSIYLI